MKSKALLCLLLLIWSGSTVSSGKTSARSVSSGGYIVRSILRMTNADNTFNLADFGAVGDGVADDGPALQDALDAIAVAGGGTLFVPAGRYAIVTPVQKNFTGLASDISILGVESLTPVPPVDSSGQELTRGLDLFSEFAPRTGEQGISINITGLQSFLIKDIAFIGTPNVNTDALITLALNDIGDATVRHCEFYGLASIVAGGAIVRGIRSHLKVEQTVFLGSTCASGHYSSVVQNIEWKSVTIADTIFADYGQRPELFGKMHVVAPFSWVNIGNATAVESDSPRREAVIRNVFFDEGSLSGLSSLPYRFQPASAPIDLIYVSGLFMNVSNLGTWGNYLYGAQRVLIENSHYGWSHNADVAIDLLNVGDAILDRVECVASADRIRADSATRSLTVIDSTYNELDSQAQTTRIITTNAPEEDPVQYVRQQFVATLQRGPDAAGHYYWSDQILQCGDNSQCVDARRAALGEYLAVSPQEKFEVSGQVVDEEGSGIAGLTVALSGSQNVTTETDASGRYRFSNLPTSGVYTVTPSRRHYTLNPVSSEIVTPAVDQIFNSVATFNHHSISGQVADGAGIALANVTVTLSGSQRMTTTTGADGEYVFEGLPAGGNYTVTPRKTSYAFSPANQTFNDLDADPRQNFTGTFVTYSIRGILVGPNNNPLPGITVNLSGSQQLTTTSDSAGDFLFPGLPSEGNYTVTPTRVGYLFNPSSRTYNALAADHYHNYAGTFTIHSISGRVTESGDAALSGALVTLSGNTSGTTLTDANGNYNFPGLLTGGDYSLTVSKTHYTFATPSRTFDDLAANQTANFAATLNRHSLTGRATASDGSPLTGVTVTLSGSQTSSATTDSNGAYSFANLPAGGNYTVTPSKTSYSWAPQSRAFNDLGSNQTADFMGTLVRHVVSGRVTENGTGLSGVSILLSGSQTSSATTDAGGNYSFNLPSEGNYTFTPVKQHYTFTPGSRTFNNLIAAQTGDFAATRNRHTISGRVININNTGVAGITVSLSGSQTATANTNSAGDYSFANLPAGGTYTVQPSLEFHSFNPASQTYTNLASSQQGLFVVTLNTHTISGRLIDAMGVPIEGGAVALSGLLGPITTATTGVDGKYFFGPLPAGTHYVVSVSKPNYTFNPASRSFSSLNSDQTADFTTSLERLIEFSAANYNVSEGTAAITITVTRTGNTSGEAAVAYSGSNGTGTQGQDVSAIIGRLNFAPGETTQTFTILITDDALVEGVEQLILTLTDPQGAALGSRASATLSINDNDSGTGAPNPVDQAQFFVRQHYRDFLNREADAGGLDFWSNQILSCGTDAACIADRRMNVSAAFFLSIEFQQTGFLVYRLYQASFARPPQHLAEFLLDTRTIGEGVVVNAPGWQALLEANTIAFIEDFVSRAEFGQAYPLSLTPAEFVNLLNSKTGGALSPADIAAVVAEFQGATTSNSVAARARALRRVAENGTFLQRQLSPAFVLMEYFGYLQRNPNDPPDTNLDGYNFWLNKLTEFGGDFRRAEMVKSFLNSAEYRARFGTP